MGLIPGSGRSSGIGNGNLLQYSCLENSIDRGAWPTTIYGVSKGQTQLSTHVLQVFIRTSWRTFMRTQFISCGKIPISDSSIEFLCLISLALKIFINLLPSVKFCLPFYFTSIKTSSKPSPSWFLISCPSFLFDLCFTLKVARLPLLPDHLRLLR